MERTASSFDFRTIEKLMFNMDDNHSSSDLNKLKNTQRQKRRKINE